MGETICCIEAMARGDAQRIQCTEPRGP